MDVFIYLFVIVFLVMVLFPCKKSIAPAPTPTPAPTPILPNCCQSKCGIISNMYQPCDDPFSWGPTYPAGPNFISKLFAFRRTPVFS